MLTQCLYIEVQSAQYGSLSECNNTSTKNFINDLQCNKDLTILDIFNKNRNLSIEQIDKMYTKSNVHVKTFKNAVEHESYFNDNIKKFIANVNNELNNYLDCNDHLNLEQIRVITYKTNQLSYVANLISKEKQLTSEELNILNMIKTSEQNITDMANSSKYSKMELLEIYLRSDAVVRALYDTINYYLYNQEEIEDRDEMNWKDFCYHIRFAAKYSHDTDLDSKKLDDAYLKEIMFKLGEIGTINFKEKKEYKFNPDDIILE